MDAITILSITQIVISFIVAVASAIIFFKIDKEQQAHEKNVLRNMLLASLAYIIVGAITLLVPYALAIFIFITCMVVTSIASMYIIGMFISAILQITDYEDKKH